MARMPSMSGRNRRCAPAAGAVPVLAGLSDRDAAILASCVTDMSCLNGKFGAAGRPRTVGWEILQSESIART
ncbi:hypothetical protein Ait01nite_062850 [Actinoplanes italicus]|nr:hypothetical protein Ait01nite_062850 [Actinoplanes italicus]